MQVSDFFDTIEPVAGLRTIDVPAAPAPEPAPAPSPAPAPEPAEAKKAQTDAPETEEQTKNLPSKKAPPKKAPPRGKPPKGKAPPGKRPPGKRPPGKPLRGKAPPPRKGPPPKSTKELLIGLLIKIAVVAALIWAVFTFVLGVSVHYGNNMHPAIRDGDLVVTLRMQKPYINAAVLYKHDGETKVGRVIALEGSVVDIHENGSLTVNGITPSEEVFYATYQADGAPITFPYTVEPGKVFILNDFRNDTNDSRSFGAVNVKDLMGPALFTVRRRNF